MIGVGEYQKSKAYQGWEVHWASEGENAYFALRAKTSGWVAIGFQSGSRMNQADMVLGLVSSDKAAVYDLYSTGDFGPHPADTELGGSNDVAEFGGKEAEGYTIIEFKRRLKTGDRYDYDLTKEVHKIIWAYGSSDSFLFAHIAKGYGEIEF